MWLIRELKLPSKEILVVFFLTKLKVVVNVSHPSKINILDLFHVKDTVLGTE